MTTARYIIGSLFFFLSLGLLAAGFMAWGMTGI
jgi:hypothetical protein